jgi:hypothetical protein
MRASTRLSSDFNSAAKIHVSFTEVYKIVFQGGSTGMYCTLNSAPSPITNFQVLPE